MRHSRMISALVVLSFLGVVVVLYVLFGRSSRNESGTTGVNDPDLRSRASMQPHQSSVPSPVYTSSATGRAGSSNGTSPESQATVAAHPVSAHTSHSGPVPGAEVESQATTRQSATVPSDNMSEELRTAMREFREQPIRVAQARKLIPLLKAGLDTAQVEAILGPPSSRKQWYGGLTWGYVIGYSQFISVAFDNNGKVVGVRSTVSTAPDEVR